MLPQVTCLIRGGRIVTLKTTSPKDFCAKHLGSQKFLNGEVHRWYRTVHGFADHLVSDLLEWFDIGVGKTVLDPFCGSGTTLVECMKRGVTAYGIDANPASCFTSNVKTTWNLQPAHLEGLAKKVEDRYQSLLNNGPLLREDRTFRYLLTSGMLARDWIGKPALLRTIALKHAISDIGTSERYRRALLLALMAEFVYGASNVRFGPELYCGPKKFRVRPLEGFLERVSIIADDLRLADRGSSPAAKVICGDSRDMDGIFETMAEPFVDAVISSPPYPAEHDYTRNTRLELALLEEVFDSESLRAIKRSMIRSHTKGIYSTDEDGKLVEGNRMIEDICRVLDSRSAKKRHGFARLYSTVIRQYFGGMLRHFQSLKKLTKSGAMCAYVVGDQACYLRTRIPTARILSELVVQAGFSVVAIEQWRVRSSTSASTHNSENILVFRNEP